MRARAALSALLAGALIGALGAATPVAAAPIYDVKTSWSDTNLPPGGEGLVALQVRNVGDASSEEDLIVEDELPAGVTATDVHFVRSFSATLVDIGDEICAGVGTGTVKCTFPGADLPEYIEAPGTKIPDSSGFNPEPSGYMSSVLDIEVAVDPGASGVGTNTARVKGGGAAAPAATATQMPFSATPAAFGLLPGSFEADLFDAAYPFGGPVRQAGDHPFEQRVDFAFNLRPSEVADVLGNPAHDGVGLVRTVEVTLPRGLGGNPEATPKCDPVDFAEASTSANGTGCPSSTQVGYLNVLGVGPTVKGFDRRLSRVPIYNLEPPEGVPADFALNAGGYVQAHIYPTLDPGQDYAIKAVVPNISALITVRGSEAVFWGVPGDPAHDFFRFYPEKQANDDISGAPFQGAQIRPLLTNPVDCGFENGGYRIRLDSYSDPGKFTPTEESDDPLNVSGCDDPRFRFNPDISLQPTTREAGASTGLRVNLKVPQRDDAVKDAAELYAQNGDVQAIPTPPIKKTVVTLPEGMTVNPAAAQGLAACSPAQIGLGTDSPVTCPDASQFGTLTLRTPILPVDEQPEGIVYVAEQSNNPFGSFLSLYLAIEEPERGIRVKVAGRVDLDPVTGQITTTFDDLPQFPLSDVEMNVKGGLRAGLVNPQTCGQKKITATFYSWQDPTTPHTVTDSYEVTRNPDGSPCHASLADRPFDPSFAAGTTNPLAGSFSPLEIAFSRSDEDQELLGAEGAAPEGLIASLRGVGRCSEAQIAAASDPARSGRGEVAAPSCPADSLLGTVDASAGVGQVLTWVQGKVYLAGPYRGAPASGVAIVPALAGPFDLGVVVTRAPAYLDPVTAQLRLKTDPLPLIFKGVPVRVRDIRVHLDRPGFTLNPTSCEELRVEALLHSSEGKSKDASNRFQAAECASLGFRPRLALRLKGGTKRGGHPALTALYRPRPGDANTSRIQVRLPRSAFLDQAHIRTICTRVQFAAGEGNGANCPKGSIYGHVTAWTPLLEEPLSGPVILRSSDNNLPDMVAAVSGPPSLPVKFESAARIDSVGGAIRSTFTFFPDVPLSKAVLRMQGAKKGLIVNSRDLCSGRAPRARGGFVAHNGRRAVLRPKLSSRCAKQRRAKRSGHRRVGG